MRLSTYIARRTFYAIFTLVGLSILVFILARVLPGDPARMAAGSTAPAWVVEQIRKQLRLDKPLYEQYFYWIIDITRGDLGYSIYTKRSVTLDAMQYLPTSLELILLSAVFEIAGAFILGPIAGRYSYKWPDNIIRVLCYVGISLPAFVWAIILQLVFTFWIPIFPTQGVLDVAPPPRLTGMTTIDSLITGRFDAFADVLRHMALPALALAIPAFTQDARIIRSGMVENQGKDYITLAISKGLPQWLVTSKYLLKPSMIPAVTVIGMSIASMMGNAFLVETAFNWPGFSKYGTNVMMNKDLNAIIAVVLVIGIIYAALNIIVDVIVANLDPRIRFVEKGE